MLTGKSALGFLLGCMIGVYLAVMTFRPEKPEYFRRVRLSRISERAIYDLWFEYSGLEREPASPDDLSFANSSLRNSTEARVLFNRVPVVCVVFVKKISNAYAIKHSWGKKCNKLFFFSQKPDRYLEINLIPFKSSWQFLCDAIRRVWKLDPSLKWVIFGPDDLYVIPENLRRLVAAKNSQGKHYLGHNSLFWNQVYNDGEAGFVLSRATVKALLSKFNSSESCAQGGRFRNDEDYLLGKYLGELGISAGDTRDDSGRGRFHLFTPAQLMAPGSEEVLGKYSSRSLYPPVQGDGCCSPWSVTFRGTQHDLVFFYSYLLYNIKVFNSGHLGNDKPKSYLRSNQVWEKFVRQELGDVDMSKVSAEAYYEMWKLKEDSPEEFNEKIRLKASSLNITWRG